MGIYVRGALQAGTGGGKDRVGRRWGQAWDLEQAVLAGTPRMGQRTCDLPIGEWGGVSLVEP